MSVVSVRLLKKEEIQDAYDEARIRSDELDDGGEQWYEKMDVYHGLNIIKEGLDTSRGVKRWEYRRLMDAQKLIQTSVTQASAFIRICVLADYVPEFRDD